MRRRFGSDRAFHGVFDDVGINQLAVCRQVLDRVVHCGIRLIPVLAAFEVNAAPIIDLSAKEWWGYCAEEAFGGVVRIVRVPYRQANRISHYSVGFRTANQHHIRAPIDTAFIRSIRRRDRRVPAEELVRYEEIDVRTTITVEVGHIEVSHNRMVGDIVAGSKNHIWRNLWSVRISMDINPFPSEFGWGCIRWRDIVEDDRSIHAQDRNFHLVPDA